MAAGAYKWISVLRGRYYNGGEQDSDGVLRGREWAAFCGNTDRSLCTGFLYNSASKSNGYGRTNGHIFGGSFWDCTGRTTVGNEYGWRTELEYSAGSDGDILYNSAASCGGSQYKIPVRGSKRTRGCTYAYHFERGIAAGFADCCAAFA